MEPMQSITPTMFHRFGVQIQGRQWEPECSLQSTRKEYSLSRPCIHLHPSYQCTNPLAPCHCLLPYLPFCISPAALL